MKDYPVIGRTEFTKTFDLGGNKRKVLSRGVPFHYKNENGEFKEIDVTIEKDGDLYIADKAMYDLTIDPTVIGFSYVSKKTKKKFKTVLKRLGGRKIKKLPLNLDDVEINETKDRFTWKNVLSGLDIYIQCTVTGCEIFKVVHDTNAPHSFEWESEEEKKTGGFVCNRNNAGRDNKNNELRLDSVSTPVHEDDKVKRYRTRQTFLKQTSYIPDRKTRIKKYQDKVSYPIVIDTPDITETVAQDGCDAVWDAGSTWYEGYTQIYGGISGTAVQYNPGFRFTTVALPQGCTIDDATLKLKPSFMINGTPSFKLYVDDVDDAAAFSVSNLAKDITKSTAVASFSVPNTNALEIDVKTLVQEIVARGGWESGNDLRFAMLPQPGTATTVEVVKINAVEAGTSTAPTLEIDYTEASSAVDLVIAAIDHLHDIDNFGLPNLKISAIDHLHDAGSLTLTQEHELVISAIDHLHDADNLVEVIPSLSGWAKRLRIEIDNTNIDATLTNFPVVIHLSTSSGYNSDDVSCVFDELASDANRKKIAVTTSDGTTECYVEIEKWDDANEVAWLHVKVPSVSSSLKTALFLYYDSSHADNTTYVGDTNDEVAENVWDSNFMAVFHMADGADAASTYDSTSNDCDGAETGTTTQVDGKIGYAQSIAGGNTNYLSAAVDGSSLTAVTVECWGYSNAQPTVDRGFVSWSDVPNDASPFLAIKNKLDITNAQWYADSSNRRQEAISYTTWEYLAFKFASGTWDFYNNESKLANRTGRTIGTVADADIFYLGNGIANSLNGMVDEVRISDIARSDEWLKATYYSTDDSLLDFYSEEELEFSVNLVISASYHLHEADNLTLTQVHTLATAGSDHLHDADNLTLTQEHTLVVAGSDHLHDADALVLYFTLALSAVDHIHDADNIVLTQTHNLTVAESDHIHAADGDLALTAGIVIFIAKSVHLHDADALVLDFNLTLSAIDHLHDADNVVLIQFSDLAVAGSDHLHDADGSLVLTPGIVSAAIDHLHVPDNLTLTQTQNLVVAGSDHLHVPDGDLALTLSFTATAIDHLHAIDNIVLTQTQNLVVAGSDHLHVPDGNFLIQTMFPDGVDHLHEADNLILTQEHNLEISESSHVHAADNSYLIVPLILSESSHIHDVEGSITIVRVWVLSSSITPSVNLSGHLYDVLGASPLEMESEVADITTGHAIVLGVVETESSTLGEGRGHYKTQCLVETETSITGNGLSTWTGTGILQTETQIICQAIAKYLPDSVIETELSLSESTMAYGLLVTGILENEVELLGTALGKYVAGNQPETEAEITSIVYGSYHVDGILPTELLEPGVVYGSSIHPSPVETECELVISYRDMDAITFTLALTGSQFNPSVFSNYDFNSFGSVNNQVYGASENKNGIYIMSGTKDIAEDIKTGLQVSKKVFGTQKHKRPRLIDLGYGTANAKCTIVTGDKETEYVVNEKGIVKPYRLGGRTGKKLEFHVKYFDKIKRMILHINDLAR